MSELQDLKILEELKTMNILMRVNNLLLSKFILQFGIVKKELGLREHKAFFRFEIDKKDYEDLCAEFGDDDVNVALQRLDRMLLQNKLCCPHNIKNYITRRVKKTQRTRQKRKERQKLANEEQEGT